MKIVTHDGTFHCDDVLACWMLRQLKGNENTPIIRTRDMSVVEKGDFVVDVGGEYDAKERRFDHHQKGFDNSIGDNGVLLSSSGLVYVNYGTDVLVALGCPKEYLQQAFVEIYYHFMIAIDAWDNGQDRFARPPRPRFDIPPMIMERVSWMNPQWNEDASFDERFYEAMEYVGREFSFIARHFFRVKLPGERIIVEAAKTQREGYIVLPTYVPWKEIIYELEADGRVRPYSFYIYPHHGEWTVQAVPLRPASFTARKLFPAAWRGKSGTSLEKASGVKGAVFVHRDGFIASAATKEGAIKLARRSISPKEA